jgi:hypothetical protein
LSFSSRECAFDSGEAYRSGSGVVFGFVVFGFVVFGFAAFGLELSAVDALGVAGGEGDA